MRMGKSGLGYMGQQVMRRFRVSLLNPPERMNTKPRRNLSARLFADASIAMHGTRAIERGLAIFAPTSFVGNSVLKYQ
jgi:hypothetical protein